MMNNIIWKNAVTLLRYAEKHSYVITLYGKTQLRYYVYGKAQLRYYVIR